MTIERIIEAAVIAVCVMIATGTVTFIMNKFKKSAKNVLSLEKGVKALLRDRITQCCAYHEKIGYIAVHECENLEGMFVEYRNLGGNGTIESLVKRVMALPNSVPNGELRL